MDQSVARRLKFAKHQLNAGKRALAEPSDFAAGEAILRFHDALETFLLAVADHLNIPRAWRNFHQYPGTISKETKTTFSGASIVNEVNDLRVETKHYGRYPRYRDVLDLAGRIDHVFEANAQQYLGLSFPAISLASSIEHQPTSAAVAKAEAALEIGQLFESMMESQTAFQLFMSHFRITGMVRREDADNTISPLCQ